MPPNNDNELSNFHECDLFLLSSHFPWSAERSLDSFVQLGRRNIDGWGIGSYRNGRANVVKSELSANNGGEVSREFSVAMNAISSEIVLGHLRLTSSGGNNAANNHPFKLNFLGYDWLMIHNGTGRRINEIVPHDERLLINSTNDSARAFEYLRKSIIAYYCSDPKKSLIEAVRNAYTKLLENDPNGSYNIILTNGYLSWCFIHWRPFYVLNREKELGNVSLISTIKLNNYEEWIEFKPSAKNRAKMLVFSGHSLVLNGDVK